MVSMALAKALYAIPTWTRVVALVADHAALRAALGCGADTPSVDACYRFAAKLPSRKLLVVGGSARTWVRQPSQGK